MHHTKDKGDIGMVVVLADLVRNNWIVSLPLQEHAPYDLVATKGSVIRRVQVKFRTEDKYGAIAVSLRNCWGNMKGTVRSKRYSSEDVDTFAVTNGNVIAYINMDELKRMETFTIRLRPAKNNQKVNCRFAEEYALLT